MLPHFFQSEFITKDCSLNSKCSLVADYPIADYFPFQHHSRSLPLDDFSCCSVILTLLAFAYSNYCYGNHCLRRSHHSYYNTHYCCYSICYHYSYCSGCNYYCSSFHDCYYNHFSFISNYYEGSSNIPVVQLVLGIIVRMVS
jgi:hypothetical protein